MPVAVHRPSYAKYRFSEFRLPPVLSLQVEVDGQIQVEFYDSTFARAVFERLQAGEGGDQFELSGRLITWRRDSYELLFEDVIAATIAVAVEHGLARERLNREAESLGRYFADKLKEAGFETEGTGEDC